MTQKTMYDTVVGKPSTTLTAPFHAGTDSEIHVKDGSFLPLTENTASIWIADQTFLVVIGYTTRVGNTLSGVTIVQGAPVEALTATFPIGAIFGKPVSQDDMQAIQDNIRDAYTETEGKLDKQYTAAQDGWIAKVDSYDHVLKVMPASTASVSFADVTGQPTDNTSLAAALNAKIGKQYTAAEDGYLAKVDPTDHTLKVMPVPAVSATWGYIDGDLDDQTDLSDALDEKQDTLVSGTNIKTINSQSILGSGDIEIAGVSDYTGLTNKPQINSVELTGNKSLSDLGAQPELVSGTSIKTINSQSVLGAGNIQIDGVTDYEQLDNLPKINSVELTGNKSLVDIGSASASDLTAHTGNADIHVTASDKSIWSAKQNAITALAKLSADLVDDSTATNKFFHSHANTHNKNGTDEIAIDASQVTSGIFSADRIPALAYQRMVTVADESAKSALTSEDVSVGDTVYVQDGNKLYIVSSITGKGTPAEVINYVIYTAYVSWNSVTGKPASYPPSAHAGSHTNGTDDIQTANTSQKGLLSASDWNTFNAKQNAITSASKLGADLIDDTNATNKFCTAAEKTSWTGKQNAITSASKLSADLTADGTTNKVYTSAEQTKLSGIESGAQVNVKPDWNATAGTSADILNKPSTEVWTFTLTGGAVVAKNVYVGGS